MESAQANTSTFGQWIQWALWTVVTLFSRGSWKLSTVYLWLSSVSNKHRHTTLFRITLGKHKNKIFSHFSTSLRVSYRMLASRWKSVGFHVVLFLFVMFHSSRYRGPFVFVVFGAFSEAGRIWVMGLCWQCVTVSSSEQYYLSFMSGDGLWNLI